MSDAGTIPYLPTLVISYWPMLAMGGRSFAVTQLAARSRKAISYLTNPRRSFNLIGCNYGNELDTNWQFKMYVFFVCKQNLTVNVI